MVAADDPGLELHRHERDVLESLNEVIFRTDAEGTLRFLNLAWQRVSGYEVEQSLGHRLTVQRDSKAALLARPRRIVES